MILIGKICLQIFVSFWKAYPAFKGRKFEEMSNPTWFKKDPLTGWGFFGHR